jgi:Cd2+/Zn2+-exporting ATPase
MTGTLCSDNYTISNIYPIRISDEQLLYLAACAEEFSNHPLAKAIKEASTIPVDRNRIIKHHEEQGVGCIAQLDTLDIISIGNLELMERLGINGDLIPCDCTVVYVAVGKTYVGRIELYGQINNGAERTVTELKKSGVSNVAMITGDNTLTATAVGRAVGISEIYADCLPKDKFDRVKYILDTQEKDDKLAFVCRSNGNIRAMELANVSITLDGNGENAMSPDIAIIGKDITNVSKAVKISKKIVGIIKENLILSALCEVAVIALTLTGIINMWFSALVNLILSVAVMMNSARFKNIPWRSKTKEID